MKRRYETHIDIDDNGKPRWYDATLVQNYLSCFPKQRAKVSFMVLAPEKSKPLMKYYWGVAIPIVQRGLRDIGYNYNPEQAHEFAKQFCPVMHRTIEVNGKMCTEFLSLADDDFDNGVFLQYLEELKQWVSEELHEYIPDPNERPDAWNQ